MWSPLADRSPTGPGARLKKKSSGRKLVLEPLPTPTSPHAQLNEYYSDLDSDLDSIGSVLDKKLGAVRSKKKKMQRLPTVAPDSLFDSPFNPHMTPSEITNHPFGQVVENGWKRVAEGLRQRLQAALAVDDELRATMAAMLTVEQSAALVSHDTSPPSFPPPPQAPMSHSLSPRSPPGPPVTRRRLSTPTTSQRPWPPPPPTWTTSVTPSLSSAPSTAPFR